MTAWAEPPRDPTQYSKEMNKLNDSLFVLVKSSLTSFYKYAKGYRSEEEATENIKNEAKRGTRADVEVPRRRMQILKSECIYR